MSGLHPISGEGVLSRRGQLALLCSADPVSAAVIDAVLDVLTDVANTGGDATVLADRLAVVLGGPSGLSVVAFGPADGGVLVAVFGHAWADVTTEHGEQRLALRQSSDGVRSLLPGTLLSIRAGLGDVDSEASHQQWGDLDQGTVHAAGLWYAPAAPGPEPGSAIPLAGGAEPGSATVAPPAETAQAAPALLLPPPDEPVPAPPPVRAEIDRSKPFSSVVLSVGGGAAPAEQRAPLPVAAPPSRRVAPEVAPPPHPVEDHGVQVLGVYCKNGHFNDPAARYCAICGISMAQLTLIPRPGPRPPLGVLVLDDGVIFSLETDYVIGRDPSRDARVLAGTARPVRLNDPKGLMSRAHVLVRLDGWQVQVVDLASANGTGIIPPGGSAWQTAPRSAAVTIRPGTLVGFGQRQLRYESHTNT